MLLSRNNAYNALSFGNLKHSLDLKIVLRSLSASSLSSYCLSRTTMYSASQTILSSMSSNRAVAFGAPDSLAYSDAAKRGMRRAMNGP